MRLGIPQFLMMLGGTTGTSFTEFKGPPARSTAGGCYRADAYGYRGATPCRFQIVGYGDGTVVGVRQK